MEFPQTVTAVREFERAERGGNDALWRIGDALIAKCGRDPVLTASMMARTNGLTKWLANCVTSVLANSRFLF